jgi:cyclase
VLPKAGNLVDLGHDSFAVVGSEDDSVLGGYGANQAFTLLEDSVLVFDSGLTTIQARNLEQKIQQLTDKKIRYLVNSHDHSDHVFGNSYFKKKYSSHGFHIISHAVCQDQLLARGSKRLAGYLRIPELKKHLQSVEMQEADITYPDLGMRLEIEGIELVLSHPPTGAHTLGDTVLYLPKSRTAFPGDIVWNRFLPNLEDANLEGWISYLEDMDLSTYQKFVPGHGKVCGPERVVEFRDYLKAVRANLLEIGQTRKINNDISSLRACFQIPGTEKWKLRAIVDHNVNAIFVSKSGS